MFFKKERRIRALTKKLLQTETHHRELQLNNKILIEKYERLSKEYEKSKEDVNYYRQRAIDETMKNLRGPVVAHKGLGEMEVVACSENGCENSEKQKD